MINYKCLGKVGPCLFIVDGIGKDGEAYYLNVNVKRRAYSKIKRTRKRQIARAKHMMALHDHTSYEWSHNGGNKALESLRGGVSEAITVMRGDYLYNSNYHYCDCLQG